MWGSDEKILLREGGSWDFTEKYTYTEVKLSKKLYGTLILETEWEG